eukprot:9374250-Pyramimonas_sp.AAC.1
MGAYWVPPTHPKDQAILAPGIVTEDRQRRCRRGSARGPPEETPRRARSSGRSDRSPAPPGP